MHDSAHTRALIEDIRRLIPPKWTVNDLVNASELICERHRHVLNSSDQVSAAMDLLDAETRALAPGDLRSLRQLCGLFMALTFLALLSTRPEGALKSFSAAAYAANDLMGNFQLTVSFCLRVSREAKLNEFWGIAAIALGDMGMRLVRAGDFLESVAPLIEAIELSAQAQDHDLAARYNNELGLAYFELGRKEESERALEHALIQAKNCDDEDLRRQILANLHALRGE